MEGAHRPDHFGGVALVCAKLFNIVGTCTAFFGEKDAQQLRVVRRMARDLSMPVDVVGCPTVRESDGLAMSSRNVYLDAGERKRALALSKALRTIETKVNDGERDVAALEAAGKVVLEADVDSVDYLEVVDPDDLHHLEEVRGTALVCVAARVGKTRLIDNITVDGG
jgi:pantoate--beta-alanine ligase